MSLTIAYNHKGGYWKTRYSFFASFMNSVGRRFFSSPSRPVEPTQSVVYEHNDDNDDNRTNFYGEVGGSSIAACFNENVSSNKIYKSFSIEGTSNISGINTFVVNSDNSPDKQFSMGPIEDRGGVLYGHIGLSNTLLDGSNIRVIGSFNVNAISIGAQDEIILDSFDYNFRHKKESVKGSSKFLFRSDVTGAFYNFDLIQVQIGENVSYSNITGDPVSLSILPDGSASFKKADGSQFLIEGPTSVGNLQQIQNLETSTVTLIEVTPQNINGASPRGQYAQTRLTLGSAPYELLCLNLNYEPTNLDHSK
jgi:hypothetical protein